LGAFSNSTAGFAAEWLPNVLGAPVYGSPRCHVNAFGSLFLRPWHHVAVWAPAPHCQIAGHCCSKGGIRNCTERKVNERGAQVP